MHEAAFAISRFMRGKICSSWRGSLPALNSEPPGTGNHKGQPPFSNSLILAPRISRIAFYAGSRRHGQSWRQ